MSPRESLDDVRVGIEALVASTQAGPPPAVGTGLGASVMHLLRSALERILRRQFAHQRVIQLETIYLINDLNTTLQRELLQLRQQIGELAQVTLGIAETRARQTTLENTLAKLEDRAGLTESLVDELTAALSGSAHGADAGGQGASVSR